MKSVGEPNSLALAANVFRFMPDAANVVRFGAMSIHGAADFQRNNTMKKLLAILILSASAFAQCDANIWNHIYNKSRLHVIKKCVTVTGKIDRPCRKEHDGDWHCFLKLDKQFEYMLNATNRKNEFGDLVIEPICVTPPTQKDAIQACKGFSQSFPAIVVGNRVSVTGDYVLDAQHGHNELHVVYKVVKLP